MHFSNLVQSCLYSRKATIPTLKGGNPRWETPHRKQPAVRARSGVAIASKCRRSHTSPPRLSRPRQALLLFRITYTQVSKMNGANGHTSEPLIAGLAHVNLTIPRGTLDQAFDFYGDTLGLTSGISSIYEDADLGVN